MLFNKSLEFGDQNSELRALAYYWRGDANFRLGKSDESVADYKKFQSVPGAAKLKEYTISNYNIGYTFFNQEEYELAMPWFLKYIEGKVNKSLPIYTDAFNRLGDCSFVASRFGEAVAYYGVNQAGAAFKRRVPDAGDAIGNRDAGQLGAVVKRIVPDTGDTVTYYGVSHVCAVGERINAQVSDAIGNSDAG
jgi:tetratricopeptide (TPR) repeat protein